MWLGTLSQESVELNALKHSHHGQREMCDVASPDPNLQFVTLLLWVLQAVKVCPCWYGDVFAFCIC